MVRILQHLSKAAVCWAYLPSLRTNDTGLSFSLFQGRNLSLLSCTLKLKSFKEVQMTLHELNSRSQHRMLETSGSRWLITKKAKHWSTSMPLKSSSSSFKIKDKKLKEELHYLIQARKSFFLEKWKVIPKLHFYLDNFVSSASFVLLERNLLNPDNIWCLVTCLKRALAAWPRILRHPNF